MPGINRSSQAGARRRFLLPHLRAGCDDEADERPVRWGGGIGHDRQTGCVTGRTKQNYRPSQWERDPIQTSFDAWVVILRAPAHGVLDNIGDHDQRVPCSSYSRRRAAIVPCNA